MLKPAKMDQQAQIACAVSQWLEAVSDAAFARYGLLHSDYSAHALLLGYASGESPEYFARHNVPTHKIKA